MSTTDNANACQPLCTWRLDKLDKVASKMWKFISNLSMLDTLEDHFQKVGVFLSMMQLGDLATPSQVHYPSHRILNWLKWILILRRWFLLLLFRFFCLFVLLFVFVLPSINKLFVLNTGFPTWSWANYLNYQEPGWTLPPLQDCWKHCGGRRCKVFYY